MDIWKILGIDKTKDSNEIRQAYRRKLVSVNPEDDQQGFMELRSAYDEALRYAQMPEERDDHAESLEHKESFENTPVGRWMTRIDVVYREIEKRRDENVWKELLSDDVCISLETKTEARDALLRYLMDHNYLSQRIWKMLDQKFLLSEYKEELYEKFPVDYIDRGVMDNIQYKEFVDLQYLVSMGGTAYDDYLILCNRAYHFATAGKNDEVADCIRKMDELRIYHPYRDLCEIRYFIAVKDFKKAELLSDFLLSKYPQDIQILRYTGVLYANEKEFDKAIGYYQQIVEKEPDYYEANYELAEVCFAAERYEEARKYYDATFDRHKTNYIGQKINDCVEKLCEQYEQEYKEEPQNIDKALKYARSLYQLLRTGEALEVLNKIDLMADRENKHFIEYHHIMGCCFIYDEVYEKAVPHLEQWMHGTELLKEDGTEETANLRKGLVYSYLYTAYTLCELSKDYQEIERYLKKAYETGMSRIDVYEYKARILFRLKRFEEVIAVTQDIFSCDVHSVEGHVFKAMAFFEMGYIRDAVKEYDEALRLEPYDLKLYMEKVKCLMHINEYEEAGQVLHFLRENHVSYEEIDMQEAVIAAEKGETEQALSTLTRLIQDEEKKRSEENKEKNARNPFLSRLYYEAAIVYYKEQDINLTKRFIDKALEYDPESEDALYTKSILLKQNKAYEDAIEYLMKLKKVKPYHLSVNARIAEIYNYLRDYETEIEYDTMQLQIMPDARIYYDRGYAFLNLMQYEKAIRDFEKCVELDEDGDIGIYAYTAMGDAYVYDEQEEKGIKCYRTALHKTEQDPKPFIYLSMATACARLGNYEKALENVRIYREMSQEPSRDFIRIYEICGRYEEALESCLYYIDNLKKRNIEGSKRRNLHLLCRCYLLMGKTKEAAGLIEGVYTGPEESRHHVLMWKIEYYNILLRLMKKKNNAGGLLGGYFKKDFAKTELRILVDYYVNYQMPEEDGWDILMLRLLFEFRYNRYDKIKLNLPSLQRVTGKLESEIVSFEQQKIKYNQPYYLVRKAAVCIEKGLFDEALKWLEQALKVPKCQHCDFTKCSEAIFTKAVLLELMGNVKEAAVYYQEAKEIDRADIMYKMEYERISQI